MNGQTICRERIDENRKCGLLRSHPGPHRCCTLHDRTPASGWQDTRENY